MPFLLKKFENNFISYIHYIRIIIEATQRNATQQNATQNE